MATDLDRGGRAALDDGGEPVDEAETIGSHGVAFVEEQLLPAKLLLEHRLALPRPTAERHRRRR